MPALARARLRLLIHAALSLGILLSALSPLPAVVRQVAAQTADGPILSQYDDLNRLVATIKSNGQMAIYRWDAAGNLAGILHRDATRTNLTTISPNRAPVGHRIRIQGTGFINGAPGANVVTVNTTPPVVALVEQATANELVLNVPAGVATGETTITVATANGTDTIPFKVAAGSSGPPSILGLTPTIGAPGYPYSCDPDDPGTTIALTGANFQTALFDEFRVSLNSTHLEVQSATATSLTVKVPRLASSGRITVSTPAGQAVSSEDFSYLPMSFTGCPYAPEEIDERGRIAFSQARTLTITQPYHAALLLFDAPAGQQASFFVSTGNFSANISIVGLDGQRIRDGFFYVPANSSAELLGPVTLPRTGTYTFLLETTDGSGQATVTLTDPHGDPQAPARARSVPGRAVPLSNPPTAATTGGQTATSPAPSGEETWTPSQKNYRDNWRTGRPAPSPAKRPALRAAPGVTALTGQVRALDARPLARVTLQVGDQTARTDDDGRFLLSNLSAGRQVLRVDGRSASQPGRTYGRFQIGVDLQRGQTTALPYTIWLPLLDTARAVSLDSARRAETVMTTPVIPGLELRLPAGQTLRDREGQVIAQLGITAVPADRPPFPLPPVRISVAFTIQPGGIASLPPGVRLLLPNYTKQPPGARFKLWSYDPSTGWRVVGRGAVSRDGKQVVPDAGVAFSQLEGIAASPDDPPAGRPVPGGALDGDSVDLYSGVFARQQTDLALPGVRPLAVTRTQRSTTPAGMYDTFGYDATQAYELTLYSENPGEDFDLLLPDGARIRYVRTSPGRYWDENPVFEHKALTTPAFRATPTDFYASRITWTENDAGSGLRGWQLTLRDGSVYLFHAQGSGYQFTRLIRIRDRWGNQTTIERTRENESWLGPIQTIRSSNGHWLEFDSFYDFWLDATFTYAVRDNFGRSVQYEYTDAGHLWKAYTTPDGEVFYTTTYGYDGNGRPYTITDPKNFIFLTNDYYPNGRVRQQTLADGSTFQFAYDSDEQGRARTRVTDPRGVVREVSFNADGYPIRDTAALGRPEAQTIAIDYYEDKNLPEVVTNSLGQRTKLAHNATGDVTSVTRLEGTAGAVTDSFTYDSDPLRPGYGAPDTHTDPLSHTTRYGFDEKGNLRTVSDALNHVTQLDDYNEAGQPGAIVRSPVTFDRAQDLVTTLSYDLFDLVGVSDPNNRTGRQFVDGAGRIRVTTDPLGHATRYGFDRLNRLVQHSDALGGTTVFSYDPNNNLTQIIDARFHTTTLGYDNMDRLSTLTDPLQRLVRFDAYDRNGNLTQMTDREGRVAIHCYDGLNRPTTTLFGATPGPGSPSADCSEAALSQMTVGHDGLDRPTQVIDTQRGLSGLLGTERTVYDYQDVERRVIESVYAGAEPTAPLLRETEQRWDAAGRVDWLRVLNDPMTPLTYGYDAADRLRTIQRADAGIASPVTIDYDDADRRTSLTLPSPVIGVGGTRTRYGYTGVDLTGLTYTRSGLVGFPETLTYGYDGAGRRIREDGSFARINLPDPVDPTQVDYNAANERTRWGNLRIGYDNNSNVKEYQRDGVPDPILRFTWDERNQLQQRETLTQGAPLRAASPPRQVPPPDRVRFAYGFDGRPVGQEFSGPTSPGQTKDLIHAGGALMQTQFAGSPGGIAAGWSRRGGEVFESDEYNLGAAQWLSDGAGRPFRLLDRTSPAIEKSAISYTPFRAPSFALATPETFVGPRGATYESPTKVDLAVGASALLRVGASPLDPHQVLTLNADAGADEAAEAPAAAEAERAEPDDAAQEWLKRCLRGAALQAAVGAALGTLETAAGGRYDDASGAALDALTGCVAPRDIDRRSKQLHNWKVFDNDYFHKARTNTSIMELRLPSGRYIYAVVRDKWLSLTPKQLQRLDPRFEFPGLRGGEHAELNNLRLARIVKKYGLIATRVSSRWSVCVPCQKKIDPTGIRIVSERRDR